MIARRLAGLGAVAVLGPALAWLGSTAVAGAATAPSGTAPTAATAAARTAQAAQTTAVTGVRVGRHATYDRIVIDLNGPVPTWSVRAVAQVVQDGSGKILPMRGKAFLRITLHPATAHTVSRAPIDVSFPMLREVRLAGDFEGYVSFGVGLSHKPSQAGVHAFTLTAPNRLVVDVSH